MLIFNLADYVTFGRSKYEISSKLSDCDAKIGIGKCEASSKLSNHKCENVFANDEKKGFWVTPDNPNPKWIKFYLDTTYLLKILKILPAAGHADKMKSISVRFSDNATFNHELGDGETWIEVIIPIITYSNSVKITGNSNHHGPGYNGMGMSEIQIFGCNPGIQILLISVLTKYC